MRIIHGCLAIGIVVGGCSGDGGSKSSPAKEDGGESGTGPAGSGAASGSGATGGRAQGGSAGARAGRDGASGEATDDAGTAGQAGAAGDDTSNAGAAGSKAASVIPLPPGSRELEGVVNLVDAAAAAELEEYALDTTNTLSFLRDGLTQSVNLFLDHYLEEYDFVFLFTDHWIDGSRFAGRYEAINAPAQSGTGKDIEIALGGYKTTGRLKAAVVIPFEAQAGPPFAHEVLHHWAVALHPRFGFGVGRDEDVRPHWGYAGVYGQLGGFDPTTLRCRTPADAVPPACTPLSNGRFEYVVSAFGTYANGFLDVPYAPLELYLMGLIPAAQVPASIPVLVDAAFAVEPQTQMEPRILDAAGISEVTLSDIIAQHGPVVELTEAERRMRAAFVVISAEPAPDEVLDRVAEWSAILGGRMSASYLSSFETYTSGLASMDTRLGSRRDEEHPAPPTRERFECDVIEQDCGRPELACFLWPPNVCVRHGGIELDQPCDDSFACAPGLLCLSGSSQSTDYVCKPYCDSETTDLPESCTTLCPDSFIDMVDGDVYLGSVCVPET